jgi:hypothetical protein
MRLEGSCHCGAVKFSVNSKSPYPYNWCYCATCRKTGGGGGYAINIMGDAATLEIEGEDSITVYRSKKNDRGLYEADGLGFSRRHFCKHCGSMLWVWNPKWPELVHPAASAIDTPLPEPAERYAMMTRYAPAWADVPSGPGVTRFEQYTDCSIEEWHNRRGLWKD